MSSLVRHPALSPVLAITMVLMSFYASAQNSNIAISWTEQPDTLHFELEGIAANQQWDYQVEKQESGKDVTYVITIPQLQSAAFQKFSQFKPQNGIVKSVRAQRGGPDGKDVLKITVSSQNVEYFDYLTDEPSRLIFDFYTKTKTKNNTAASESKPTKKVVAKNAKKSRTPASAETLVISPDSQQQAAGTAQETKMAEEKKSGIFDGADPQFDRFSIKDYEIKEDSIIASQEDIFLDFPMLRLQTFSLSQMTEPVYEITPKDTDENKQARLLLTLYKNKRYHVFLKTVDWFIKKYPDSSYDEIVRFLWADNLFALWMQDRNVEDFEVAMLRYRQALEKYPNSALLERTMMLMGFASLDRGDYLTTLRLFQQHIDKRPDSPNRDIARLAVAEAFLKINKYDDSLKQYEGVEAAASNEKYRTEAAYLKGDVSFQKKDYAQAIATYKAAMQKYPTSISQYPNALYNQAASQFGLKNYRESLNVFNEFIKLFPSHEYAGYAMTRVGELLQILGADSTKVVGAFLEAYFRYGDSPSAIVARLRLLSQRMPNMKVKEVEKAVKDIEELAQKSDLPGVEQFANLMISDGFVKRKEYQKAVDRLVSYYQQNPTSADTKLLSFRIAKHLNDKINNLIDNGDFIETLKNHEQYKETWLKHSDRIDTKINIGRAFELAGVPQKAELFYQDSLNRLYSIQGTQADKMRKILERPFTADFLNLRLAEVSYAQNKYSQAYDFLRQVKQPQSLTMPEQIHRVRLAAKLLEQRGDLSTATVYLSNLIQEWKGEPAQVSDTYLDLAKIEAKQNKKTDALKSLNRIDEMMTDSGKVPVGTHAQSLELKAKIELDLGKKTEAAQTIDRLLNLYETSRPIASMRYKLGEIQFAKGEIQKASETWQKLNAPKTEFWYKLAQEQLEQSKWREDYNKYIKRIPAMENPAQQPQKTEE